MTSAAARALGACDPIGALKRVGLRGDPPALALRGIAMAQLGQLSRARELLRLAARRFGSHEPVARARCVVAEAEVALAMRDLRASTRELAAAATTLEARSDRVNTLHARLIALRRLLLIGRLDEATLSLAALDKRSMPPTLQAAAELAAAELSLRAVRTAPAVAALARARAAAERAGIPALLAEVAEAAAALDRAAARRVLPGAPDQLLRLHEVEALVHDPGTLLLDGLRRGLRANGTWLPMVRRPILFVLALALARAWPADADRSELIALVFRTRHPDETHRARLRVEIGRLRALIKPLAHIEATARGFAIAPLERRTIAILVPPMAGGPAALLGLLSDGAAWSTSALALALGENQRAVQRALVELQAAQRVRSVGRGRAQRWLTPPLTEFTTILLLPASLPLP
jgi:hypothetical protein